MSKFTAQIHKDSVPNLDSWGPDDYWDCEDWIKWYEARKSAYGKADAKLNVEKYFTQRSAFGHELTCLSKSFFYDYFKREGVKISDDFFETTAAATGTVRAAAEAAENASKTTSTIAKFIPYIILVIIGLFVFWAFKNSGEVIKLGKKIKLI